MMFMLKDIRKGAGWIGATEYAGGDGTRKKGREVRNRMREGKGCGTYSVGVKDLASAYVLCPHLAEGWGLSIYRRTEVME